MEQQLTRTAVRASRVCACALALLAGSAAAIAAPSPVRYTEVVDRPVRRDVTLPGTVESRKASVVASEVAGQVVEILANEGDRVKQGQLLARLRKVDLELLIRAEQGRLEEARSRLELASSQLERARSLHADEVISQNDLDNALAEQAAWTGRVEEHQAELERLRVALVRSDIPAPFGGVVTARHTEVGEWIAVGGAVVDLLALDDLRVRLDVPERYFDLIEPGLGARVRFDALPELGLEGRVEAVIPQADPRARTFPVQLRIPNPEGRVGVGMLAQVELSLGSSYTAALVPKDALVRQGSREFVYRITEEETVEPVDVTSGPGLGAWVAVDGELRPGERVVVRGNERLFPGQAVEGQPLQYPLP